MQHLLAKIGKGGKGAKDLTWEEAKAAAKLLIEGQATPAQIGGFLVAMRMKTESIGELAALTAGAREYVPVVSAPSDLPLVDFPVYAEKRDTCHISIAAAIISAAAGAPVLMHGCDSEASGSVASVLSTLGIPTGLDTGHVQEALTAHRFAYLDLALYHPPLARFLDFQRELGVQTFFHPLVRLLNPARARSQVIGTLHPPYLQKLAEVLKMLGGTRALVVRGVEGDPELSVASVTNVVELRQDRTFPLTLLPEDFKLPTGTHRDMTAPPGQEAAHLKGLLNGTVHGGPRRWMLLNAALLLYAAGLVRTISAGLPVASRIVESGSASQKLAELVSRSETSVDVPRKESIKEMVL